MSKIISECKPYAMSDEEWAKKATGGGKVATLWVGTDDGFEVNVVVRGIAAGSHIPEYKKAGAVVHAKREITHNKLIHGLREKLLRKKIIAEVAAKGGAGGGGK